MMMADNDPGQWSISYEQLLELEVRAKKHFGQIRCAYSVTMRDIAEDLVIPECRRSGAPSWAQHVNPNGLPVGAFVTHSWDGQFVEFVHAIKLAFYCFPKDQKPNLWICAFALPQGHGSALRGIIATDLQDTPFVRALRAATFFVVVRNSNKDIYNRIWCVCELMFAHSNNKLTLITGPNTHSSDYTSCQYAQFSFEEDAIRIKEELLLMYGTYEDVDNLVRQYRRHPRMNQEKSYPFRVFRLLLYIALSFNLLFYLAPWTAEIFCESKNDIYFKIPRPVWRKCFEHLFLVLALMACDPILCGALGLTSLTVIILGITGITALL